MPQSGGSTLQAISPITQDTSHMSNQIERLAQLRTQESGIPAPDINPTYVTYRASDYVPYRERLHYHMPSKQCIDCWHEEFTELSYQTPIARVASARARVFRGGTTTLLRLWKVSCCQLPPLMRSPRPPLAAPSRLGRVLCGCDCGGGSLWLSRPKRA